MVIVINGQGIALTNLAKTQMMNGEIVPILNDYAYEPPEPSTDSEKSHTFCT